MDVDPPLRRPASAVKPRPGLTDPVKSVLQIATARSSKKNAPVDSSQANATIMANAGSLHAVSGMKAGKQSLMAARDLSLADSTHGTYYKKAVQHGLQTGAHVKAAAEKSGGPSPTPAQKATPARSQFRDPQDLNTTDRKLYYHAIDGYGSAIPEPDAIPTTPVVLQRPSDSGHSNLTFLDISPRDMIMGTRSRQIEMDVDQIDLPGRNAKTDVIALLNPNAVSASNWADTHSSGPMVDLDVDRDMVVSPDAAQSASQINVALCVNDSDNSANLRSKRRRRPAAAAPFDEDAMEYEDTRRPLVGNPGVRSDGQDDDAMDVDNGAAGAAISVSDHLKHGSISSDIVRLDPADLSTAADCEVFSKVAQRKKQLMLKSSDISKVSYDSILASSDTPGLVQASPMETAARVLKSLFGNAGDSASNPVLSSSNATQTILSSTEDIQPEVYFSVSDAKRVASSFGTTQRLSIFQQKLNQFFIEQTQEEISSFLNLFDPSVLERLRDDPAVQEDPSILTGGVDMATWMYEFQKRRHGNSSGRGAGGSAAVSTGTADVRTRQNTFLEDQQHHANVISTLARFSPIYRAIEEQEEYFKSRGMPCYSNRQEQLARNLLEHDELPNIPTLGRSYIEIFTRSYRPSQVISRGWYFCDRGLDCVCRQIGTAQAGGTIFISKNQPGYSFSNTAAHTNRGRAPGTSGSVSVGVNVTASGTSVISSSIDARRMKTLIHTNPASGATAISNDSFAKRAVSRAFRPNACELMSDETKLYLGQLLYRSNGGSMELDTLLGDESEQIASARADVIPDTVEGWNYIDGFIGVQFLLPEVYDAVSAWTALPADQRSSVVNPALESHGLCYYCYVHEVNRRDCELTQGIAFSRRRRNVNVNIHPQNGHFLPLNAFQVKIDCSDGYPRDNCISSNIRSPGKSAVVGHFPIFMLNNLTMHSEKSCLRVIDTGANFLLS